MPEYIRALVVILFIGLAGFLACRPAMVGTLMSAADFDRRRKYWFIITLAGFLSQEFLLFAIVLVVVLNIANRSEPRPLVLFFFLLLALPQLKAEVPGFAGIRYLVAVDYVQILSVMLLLPLYLKSRARAGDGPRPFRYVDHMLLAYVVLNIALQALSGTTTSVVIRNAVYWLVDVLLPYYAISRGIEKLEDFKEIFAALVVGGVIVALVAMVEFAKHWLLYMPMQDALSLPNFSNYLDRGEFIRSLATSGQPIVLGYVLMAVIGACVYVKDAVAPRWLYWLGLATLLGGEISTLSKGPWLGLCVVFLILLLTGRKVASTALRWSLLLLPAVAYVMSSSAGESILQYLPFVGTVDEYNVTYRQRLMEKGLELVNANPWFGSSDYLSQMEELRQGQGIIDIVNSYLGVALDSGLVGLALFAGFFLAILWLVNRARLAHRAQPDFKLLGNVLLAVSAGMLLVLVSVSAIYHVKIIYMSFAAFGLAYARLSSKIPADQL